MCDDLDILEHLVAPRKKMRIAGLPLCSTNVTFQEHKVGREERASVLGKHGGFRGCTIWFTGLSGAGKTTIAFALEKILTQLGVPCYGLDGDNIRHGLCKNLGFSREDRSENIRRVGEVAHLFADAGFVCLASFISPFRADRHEARRVHEAGNIPFMEVYMDASLEVCESRDPKKLYKKARAGEVSGMTGIDSEYEAPEQPDITIHSGTENEGQCVIKVLRFLADRGILPEKVMHEIFGAPVRELYVKDAQEMISCPSETRPAVELTTLDLQWLQVLAEGWATPLGGFMRERQYLQSLHFGQLLDLKKECVFPGEEDKGGFDDGYPFFDPINQSIPIVLPIDANQKDSVTIDGAIAKEIVLRYKGKDVGILKDGEVFEHRKQFRVCRQFGCSDARHPGVANVLNSGDFCLGGEIEVLERIRYDDGLDGFRHSPMELRKILQEKGADAVFVFQLRNPIHNGHALLMKETREKLLKKHKNPVLLLHPLGGWTKDDDVPLPVRIKQHQAVIEEGVLGQDWTVLSIFPSPMMYAGPIEVQWHARARMAAGVHTYIVGRDPAGIQDPADPSSALYEVTYGAKVLSMAPGLSSLEIVPFRVAAYDKEAGQMAIFDPKRKEHFEFISGTKMRTLAKTGQHPPDGFMAAKAWDILADYYRQFL